MVDDIELSNKDIQRFHKEGHQFICVLHGYEVNYGVVSITDEMMLGFISWLKSYGDVRRFKYFYL